MAAQAIALLPFIDADRLRTALAPLEQTLTDEEAERNTLGDELLFLIVSQIESTEMRLSLAISVCKAWRTALKCSQVFSKVAMAARGGFSPTALKVTSSNAARLFDWLPDLAAVTSLEIVTGDKKEAIAPDVIKKALPRLNNLTQLCLEGKKITAALPSTC